MSSHPAASLLDSWCCLLGHCHKHIFKLFSTIAYVPVSLLLLVYMHEFLEKHDQNRIIFSIKYMKQWYESFVTASYWENNKFARENSLFLPVFVMVVQVRAVHAIPLLRENIILQESKLGALKLVLVVRLAGRPHQQGLQGYPSCRSLTRLMSAWTRRGNDRDRARCFVPRENSRAL